jgi:hypothetical protein
MVTVKRNDWEMLSGFLSAAIAPKQNQKENSTVRHWMR